MPDSNPVPFAEGSSGPVPGNWNQEEQHDPERSLPRREIVQLDDAAFDPVTPEELEIPRGTKRLG
jgi:hypothetical protein